MINQSYLKSEANSKDGIVQWAMEMSLAKAGVYHGSTSKCCRYQVYVGSETKYSIPLPHGVKNENRGINLHAK